MKTAAKVLGWFVVAAAGAFLFIQLSYLARVWWMKGHNPEMTAFMERHLDRLRVKDQGARISHAWVPYDRISVHLKRAIVVSEDARFVEHEGFDWNAIEKALERNRAKGRIVMGGSTISQQLAKNLFLSGERSPWRKGEEALITVMIEYVMDKRRILELYLNVIEWGDGVFGAEAAARHYFSTSALGLSAGQSARLAAMVPNPRYYDRNRSTPWLERKTRIILARMPQAELPQR